MQGRKTQCLCGLTRVLNEKFRTLVFHRCTLLFKEKQGVSLFRPESVRQTTS